MSDVNLIFDIVFGIEKGIGKLRDGYIEKNFPKDHPVIASLEALALSRTILSGKFTVANFATKVITGTDVKAALAPTIHSLAPVFNALAGIGLTFNIMADLGRLEAVLKRVE